MEGLNDPTTTTLKSSASGIPVLADIFQKQCALSLPAFQTFRKAISSNFGKPCGVLPGSLLALQRRFEGFPFFQFFHSAFPVGEVSLVIAAGMVLHQYKNVADLTFGLWKAALN